MPNALARWGPFAERTEERERGNLRRERHSGSFHRSMVLPAGAVAERALATTHDGVLEVSIPMPAVQTRETVEMTPTAA